VQDAAKNQPRKLAIQITQGVIPRARAFSSAGRGIRSCLCTFG
jgi:hypothetical protein